MLRESGAAFVILALGAWATGVLGGGYSRTVDKPPAQVVAALADLDIRNAPGAPGTDPLAAGASFLPSASSPRPIMSATS